MTTAEMKAFLAAALRSIADHVEAGTASASALCLAIPCDFRLEALSQAVGCKVSATIADGQASVVVAMNDPTDAGPPIEAA